MEIAKILNGRITVLKNMRLFSAVTLLLICAGCASIARIDGPYEGKVIDAETNQPLEGVVVHGTWYRVHATPAGSSSEYYDSYEVLTDKNGEFRIPGKGLLVLSNIDEMIVTIFNPNPQTYS